MPKIVGKLSAVAGRDATISHCQATSPKLQPFPFIAASRERNASCLSPNDLCAFECRYLLQNVTKKHLTTDTSRCPKELMSKVPNFYLDSVSNNV